MDEVARCFGPWTVVGFSDARTAKRALCRCGACEKISEISVEMLIAGEIPACGGCTPPRYSLSPAVQSRRFATDVAGLESWGAAKRHKGGVGAAVAR
jgi:hypothetical protein